MDDAELIERLRSRLEKDPPIEHWHVGLLADLRAGKDVRLEVIAAIEGMEKALYDAETAFLALVPTP
jgi:hypothetical protein